ncbi:MAG TPA: sigma-54 dependent transcriptional regulator [Pirellulaceae bacterium]|nr:sigma-54 dependent transcriptional regulator [Pirellulaceae bacterium]
MTINTLTETARILVVDDNARARQSMADVLTAAGHEVESSASALEALRLLDRSSFDVILTDLQMPGMSGLEFIRALEARDCDAQVAMVTAFASVSSAVEAMRHGAFDYIEKPFDAEQLEQLVSRALAQAEREGRRSSIPATNPSWQAAMIGQGPAMRLLKQRIAQVAPTDETVLICGESGTGKELVARCIHAASRRQGRALVSLNCPALSPQLLESELFGHERGAFTSADAPRVGRFELAEGGTILLDEVTEIELGLQAKLLRVLQERTYERVGSSESRKADVRVVATTNRDIRQAVAAGQFRQDLYYRLAVVPITVPPLRERSEDVPLLVRHFLSEAARRTERAGCELDGGALDLLCHYHWPGNVREVENVVTRACVLFAGRTIGADDLRPWLLDTSSGFRVPGSELAESTTHHSPLTTHQLTLAEMERKLIETTLEHVGGHRAKAARVLGIGIRTLTNKLRAYGYAPRTKAFAKAA